MQKKAPSKKCLICNQSSFGLFQDKEDLVCYKCRRKISLMKNNNVLFIYNDFFRELLFRYKAMGDLVLAPLFLFDFKSYLHHKYKDYLIILVPSNEEDNFRRGFSFLPWVFHSLDLPMISPFKKTKAYKQATSKHREDVQDVIVFKEDIDLKGKKLLLVDDVMTSGYTIKTCMELLKTKQPKCIDYLVLACRKENLKQSIQLIEKGR